MGCYSGIAHRHIDELQKNCGEGSVGSTLWRDTVRYTVEVAVTSPLRCRQRSEEIVQADISQEPSSLICLPAEQGVHSILRVMLNCSRKVLFYSFQNI